MNDEDQTLQCAPQRHRVVMFLPRDFREEFFIRVDVKSVALCAH